MSLNKSKSLRTAEKYVLQGKIPAAIDEYRKVVEMDPADLTTINTLGDLYVRAGRIQDAIQNFSRIADSYRDSGFTLKAIAMLKKISKLDPTNIDTAMKLANLYSQQGLLVEARQQYLQVADAYARSGQARKALEAYQKIADLDPSNTSVRMKLAEIYSREGMTDHAHESFIMAGAEFIRKGEMDQALNANLKALTIQPESRQALTAIVNIYSQQGQAERAINILCDAFEKTPGDVELLTILGRTYLAAGWMDEAERTFLSLVELDKNRYTYLLEVGRKFLQLGNLDRAAEQIDGCLDVLISKREEDKAIDFLRKVLDKDQNHTGALRRLAQIFLRIREDHNLIATLNTLAEAAIHKNNQDEAVAALRELARLEPDEPRHRQKLYNLGIRDITDPTAPDVVRATGPLDYGSAAFDDAFVVRQISEAEILAGHGQIDHAVAMLTEILKHAPDNIQIHLKLRDIYSRAGSLEKATAECMELARLCEARGEPGKAADFVAEAQQMNPLLDSPRVDEWSAGNQGADQDYDTPMPAGPQSNGASFELRELTGGLDLSRYQTGALGDHMGFVMAPSDTGRSGAQSKPEAGSLARPSGAVDGQQPIEPGSAHTPPPGTSVGDQTVFTGTGNVHSDTVSRILLDELEGVDFYIAQGYVDIARDTLDRLRDEHGDHHEILIRYKRLGISAQPTQAITPEPPVHVGEELVNDEFSSLYVESTGEDESIFMGEVPRVSPAAGIGATTGELMPIMEQPGLGSFSSTTDEDLMFPIAHAEQEPSDEPFMVHKETGPLNEDLLVHLNTSDLSRHHLTDDMSEVAPPPLPDPVIALPEPERIPVRSESSSLVGSGRLAQPPEKTSAPISSGRLAQPPHKPSVTADLIASLVSGLDATLGELGIEELFDASHGDGAVHHSPPESVVAHPEPVIAYSEPVVAQPEQVIAHPETLEVPEPLPSAAEPFAEPTSTAPPAGTAWEDDFGELARVAAPELVQEVIQAPKREQRGPGRDDDLDVELREMLEELKGNTSELKPVIDFETHYSLGLAYKDMDLLDEAIEQFQSAYRLANDGHESNYIQCCHMLGVCFNKKHMPKLAIMWFERGLKVSNRPEDEYQALRFEIGLCHEKMGDLDKAIEVFAEVYGIDVNYRQVSSKLKELQAAKNA
jgi:tetratricopeptide (TPR) repeat protein